MSHVDSTDEDLLEMQEAAEHRASLSKVLFVTDAEMLRRIGVSEKIGRIAIRELEKRQEFPPKDPLFGNKRYWPAVRAFFDARGGVTVTPPRSIYTRETGGTSQG
jgi:hypothetical protein